MQRDPVSWYNANRSSMVGELLQADKWQTTDGINFIKNNNYGVYDDDKFTVITQGSQFEIDTPYSPFEVLTLTQFKGNWRSAVEWVLMNEMGEQHEYIRVATDYFKKTSVFDRYGIVGHELTKWTRNEIELDHGKEFLRNIPHYDGFCIKPNNLNFQPVIANRYNLYSEFRHKSSKGDWTWTERLIRHVFGEQFEQGMKYLQALYLYPEKMLPILVLVSKERQTGKTTFLNWLNMIFGMNMTIISPDDLSSNFNSVYARSNIIAIEETLIDKSVSIEKLKSLSTGKFISVNAKYVQQYKIPFFGKIILTSNNEDKFVRIDDEEIRFFIRKLGFPQYTNHLIEDNLIEEIPAFLYELESMEDINWERSRMLFTAEELNNDSLDAVKKESKSWLYKELYEKFEDHFINYEFEWTYCTPIDIKDRWFANNNQVTINFIRHVLKDEFKLKPFSEVVSYVPFNQDNLLKRSGRAYQIFRSTFNL